jgi:hypothetical protein
MISCLLKTEVDDVMDKCYGSNIECDDNIVSSYV